MRQFLAQLIELISELHRQQASPMASLERSFAAAHRAHTSARRALAVAMAEESREAERRNALSEKLCDVEKRAVEALRAGRDDLALQAAETIAALTTEIRESERASGRFAAEVTLARREVDAQRRRLSDLDRGRRLVRIGAALNGANAASGTDSFAEAEAALVQMQAENQDARFVRDEMAGPTERLIERMSDAGFGEPIHVRPADILARLRSAAGLSPPHLIEATSNSQ